MTTEPMKERMTARTDIDPTLRHGATFELICRPDWVPAGIWPEVDALAAEHREAVEAYEEAAATAPHKPSLAEYDRACRAAIDRQEPLPEPPSCPTDAEIEAGVVRVTAARDRVMVTATAILTAVRANREAMADAPTIRGPIRDAEDRIRELEAELAAAHRTKARYERMPMWLAMNAKRPWIDPNPEHYPDPAEAAFGERLMNITG